VRDLELLEVQGTPPSLEAWIKGRVCAVNKLQMDADWDGEVCRYVYVCRRHEEGSVVRLMLSEKRTGRMRMCKKAVDRSWML